MEGFSEKEIQPNQWVRFGLRLCVSAALHPFEYSKVLIQLGYEPIPPRPGKSFFGKDIYIFPSIFEYTSYIKKIDGLSGCYRGLTPKLVGSVIGTLCSEKLAEKFADKELETQLKNESELSDEELFRRYQKSLKKELIIHVSGIIITHPFQVISLRMMATFIGRETNYRTLFGSIIDVYKNEGISGFFNGIIPKLISDVTIVVLSSTVVYLFSKYFIKDKDGRVYFSNISHFIYSSIMYPFNVVSTCSAISGSKLAAGSPPLMPEYDSWMHCFKDLRLRGELKRGSSLIWRTIPRPSVKALKLASMNNASVPLPEIAKYA